MNAFICAKGVLLRHIKELPGETKSSVGNENYEFVGCKSIKLQIFLQQVSAAELRNIGCGPSGCLENRVLPSDWSKIIIIIIIL